MGRGQFLCDFFFFLARKYLQLCIHHGKKSTASHKEQTSHGNDFRVFPCMGRDKTLGSLESFLRYASNYLGAPVIQSTECFLLFPPDGE